MIFKQQNTPLHILHAEDDKDDRFFFAKALKEIPIATHLTSVNDGEELSDYLFENQEKLPDILFLDLNMPRKTGYECLAEINENKMLKNIFIAVLSTSFPRDIKYELTIATMLCVNGANTFIRKPDDYLKLKKVIRENLIRTEEKRNPLASQNPASS